MPELCASWRSEVAKVIVGKERVLNEVLIALLANGHVLFEDLPGLAKTLIVRCFAQVLGCQFSRIQFTPDLLPADITGTNVLNRTTGAFELRQGPIFAHTLLADEINRAPPKTQSALLEGMQERQVTIERATYPLPQPFIVFATQNPIEFEGTYPLPEAQVDRFLLRLTVGYPSAEEEQAILARRIARGQDEAVLPTLGSPQLVVGLQKAIEQVHVDDDLQRYMVELVRKTREDGRVEVGASPRGSLALLKASRARAALLGRDYVLPDDVKAIAVPALAHRLILRADAWVKAVRGEEIIRGILDEVPVPKVG